MATKTVNVTLTAKDETASAFNSLNEKLSTLKDKLKSFTGGHSLLGNIFAGGFGAGAAMAAVSELKQAAEEVAEATYNDTVAYQSWQFTMQAAGLTASQTQQELKFLSDTSMELGLNIQDTGSSFGRFLVSLKTSGEALPEINSQFKAINEIMRVFHLQPQKATRAWIAFTEIAAQGKVSARQFNQQLSRDFSGLGPLIAKTMFPVGNSMQEFRQAMKEGKISSEDFFQTIVKLANSPAMQSALKGAVNSIQAAMGRLHDSIFNILNQANNPKGLQSMTDAINTLAQTLNSPSIQQGFASLVTGLAEVANAAAKTLAFFVGLGNSKVFTYLMHVGISLVPGGQFMSMGLEYKDEMQKRLEILKGAKESASIQQQIQDIIAKSNKAANAQSSATNSLAQFMGPSTWMQKTRIQLPQVSGALPEVRVEKQGYQPFDPTVLAKTTAQLQKIKVEFQQIKPAIGDVNKEMSEYTKEAARNMQDTFAKFLFDPFKEGLRGMVLGFVKAIQEMAAQALAAKVFNALGKIGQTSTGSSTGGSEWGSILGAIGRFFGGARASGGSVSGNHAYLVGEHGPEIFSPSTSGNIIPNHALRGSYGQSSPTVNIDARGAGPDEVAKLLAMRNDIIRTMQSSTEFRLQRGAWRQTA